QDGPRVTVPPGLAASRLAPGRALRLELLPGAGPRPRPPRSVRLLRRGRPAGAGRRIAPPAPRSPAVGRAPSSRAGRPRTGPGYGTGGQARLRKGRSPATPQLPDPSRRRARPDDRPGD